MIPYQRTLQMYCTFISSKECAKSCFSKTLHAPAKTILRKQFVSFDGGTTNLPATRIPRIGCWLLASIRVSRVLRTIFLSD